MTEVSAQMEALGELKEYLKIFVKEREHQYRIKIEKRLYGRHYSGEHRRESNQKKRKECPTNQGSPEQMAKRRKEC